MRADLHVKYFEYEDLSFLNDWLREREHKTFEYYELPAVGFIVSEGDLRIATCFLRRCEGGYGIVDGLASNPEAESWMRDQALDLVVQMVCEEAKQRGITRLVAWTIDSSTLERGSTRHGFLKSQNILLFRDLAEHFSTQ